MVLSTRTRESREQVRQRVLEGLLALTEAQGFPPSYRQLADYVGTAHSNVWYAVEQLRRTGLIQDRDAPTARTLVLTHAGRMLAWQRFVAKDAKRTIVRASEEEETAIS